MRRAILLTTADKLRKAAASAQGQPDWVKRKRAAGVINRNRAQVDAELNAARVMLAPDDLLDLDDDDDEGELVLVSSKPLRRNSKTIIETYGFVGDDE